MRITRRRALAVASGAAVAAAGGSVAIRGTSQTGLIRGALERYLGPVRIAEPDLAAFAADFSADRSWLMPSGKLAVGYQLAVDLGLAAPALAAVGAADRDRIAHFERRLLAAFVETTDVGWRQTGSDPVRYFGRVACNNPYAIFSA
jgi:hypothetical protein